MSDVSRVVLIVPTDHEPPLDVVRHWVVHALVGVPVLPRLRAGLVTDELVRNAHAFGDPPCALSLELAATGRAVRVFVEDCAPGWPAGWRSGAGLAIIDSLACDWGVELRAAGKTVWAEVALGLRSSCLANPVVPPA